MTRLVVGLIYDLKTQYVFKEGDPSDANAEFDHPDTIGVLADAFESFGYRAIRIGNVWDLIERFRIDTTLGVDIVFNIAEGIGGRNRESQVYSRKFGSRLGKSMLSTVAFAELLL